MFATGMSPSEDTIRETWSLVDEAVIADLMGLSDSWCPWVMNVQKRTLFSRVSLGVDSIHDNEMSGRSCPCSVSAGTPEHGEYRRALSNQAHKSRNGP